MTTSRKPYNSDVSDAEWAFVAPYLTLLNEDAGQRRHDLRESLNGLRWLVRTGSPWRLMPHDLPPWHAVYDQAQRPLATVVFFGIVCDTFLTMLALPVLYLLFGKGPQVEAGPGDDDRPGRGREPLGAPGGRAGAPAVVEPQAVGP